MGKKIVFYVLIIAFTALTTTIVVYDDLTGHFPWKNSSGDGSITLHISSRVLNEDRELIAWLPDGFDSTKTYPVIYALDGRSHGAEIVQTINILTAAGFAPPTMIIGIPNLDDASRKRDLTPPRLKEENDKGNSPAGQGDRFLLFLETELIPFVESRYPASGERLISGHSRAGLLALYSLLERPTLFNGSLCFSAPFWRQGGLMIPEFRRFLQRDSLNSFLYVTAGSEETKNIKSGILDIERLCRDSSVSGLSWQTVFTPHADHGDNAIKSLPGAIGSWARWRDQVNRKM